MLYLTEENIIDAYSYIPEDEEPSPLPHTFNRNIFEDLQLIGLEFIDPEYCWSDRIYSENKESLIKLLFAMDIIDVL